MGPRTRACMEKYTSEKTLEYSFKHSNKAEHYKRNCGGLSDVFVGFSDQRQNIYENRCIYETATRWYRRGEKSAAEHKCGYRRPNITNGQIALKLFKCPFLAKKVFGMNEIKNHCWLKSLHPVYLDLFVTQSLYYYY